VESIEDFLLKYKEVIKNLKKGNSIRDTAKICNVSIGTVQKVKNNIWCDEGRPLKENEIITIDKSKSRQKGAIYAIGVGVSLYYLYI
jgi:hypothetical protein